MARDTKDNSTLSLIPDVKKRGRPSTGNALSAAERKRRQRNRDSELLVKAFSDNADLSLVNTVSLIEHLQRYVANGNLTLAKDVTTELLKRTKQNANTK